MAKLFKEAARQYHDKDIGGQAAEATLLALETFVVNHQQILQDPEIDEDLVLVRQFLENVRP